MPSSKHYLTKSRFLSGLQCRKKLWLGVNHPELATPPSLKQQFVFDSGYEFEDIVMKRYPEGVLVEFDKTKKDNLDSMVSLTRDLINDNAPVIFQGAFYHDGVYVISDIIRKNQDGTWELKEMKASTAVKDVHFPDLAIQKYILENNGLYVKDTYVIHIDTYGLLPDLNSMVGVEKTTTYVSQLNVGEVVKNFQELIQEESEPDVMIGDHCTKPYECEFKDYCWKDIDEYSMLNFRGMTWKKRIQYYSSGIKDIRTLPPETKLTDNQWDYVSRLTNKEVSIDKEEIKKKLSELNYPLYFFDFETTQRAIPRWEGVHPYQQIPFQWSCHIMDENGEVTHGEYLHDEDSDPRYGLAESLLNTIGPTGSVIAYNASFESKELKKLAEKFSQFSKHLLSVESRLWDQLDIFKKYYRDYRFGKSNSIKNVLPVIDPELDHKNLELSSGDDADVYWYRMLDEEDPEKKAQLRNTLLEYCKLDTWAMVVIHKHLMSLQQKT